MSKLERNYLHYLELKKRDPDEAEKYKEWIKLAIIGTVHCTLYGETSISMRRAQELHQEPTFDEISSEIAHCRYGSRCNKIHRLEVFIGGEWKRPIIRCMYCGQSFKFSEYFKRYAVDNEVDRGSISLGETLDSKGYISFEQTWYAYSEELKLQASFCKIYGEDGRMYSTKECSSANIYLKWLDAITPGRSIFKLWYPK